MSDDLQVESELKCCPVVENICAYGNGFHNYIIAFVIPNSSALMSLAKTLKTEERSLEELCSDPKIVEEVLKEMTTHAKRSGLHKSEIPTKIKLCTEQWTPDSGLATAALKIRRKQITEFHAKDIQAMYG